MNYFKDYNETKEKLDNLIADFGLVASWRTETDPIRLILSPDASPEAQMSLLSVDDGRSATTPNARLCLTFELDNINVQIEGRLNLPQSVMNKIMCYAKKMHHFWLHGHFAASMARSDHRIQMGSNTSEDSADDQELKGNGDFDEFYQDDKSGESKE